MPFVPGRPPGRTGKPGPLSRPWPDHRPAVHEARNGSTTGSVRSIRRKVSSLTFLDKLILKI